MIIQTCRCTRTHSQHVLLPICNPLHCQEPCLLPDSAEALCRASEIRLIGGDKAMLGVMPLTRALDMAG